MIFQPPFPPTIIEPTEVESTAVFIHFAILFFLIILIMYCYKKIDSYLPVLTVYLFSLVMGLQSLTHGHAPFTPMFEIFFVIFQTTILIITALEYNKGKKRKAGR